MICSRANHTHNLIDQTMPPTPSDCARDEPEVKNGVDYAGGLTKPQKKETVSIIYYIEVVVVVVVVQQCQLCKF